MRTETVRNHEAFPFRALFHLNAFQIQIRKRGLIGSDAGRVRTVRVSTRLATRPFDSRESKCHNLPVFLSIPITQRLTVPISIPVYWDPVDRESGMITPTNIDCCITYSLSLTLSVCCTPCSNLHVNSANLRFKAPSSVSVPCHQCDIRLAFQRTSKPIFKTYLTSPSADPGFMKRLTAYKLLRGSHLRLIPQSSVTEPNASHHARWRPELKCIKTFVKDDPRSGHPTTAVTEEPYNAQHNRRVTARCERAALARGADLMPLIVFDISRSNVR
ncbi:hypothetical protein EVAR_97774_1 [Eumeta japonica]|uniref:Uncharacterized protein n=1 Tax=Eumeta variegata TaxID=151549 RepID=A0A4C1Y8T9_EUMVA|nr:hypothetical protein EVAR_97774_1 [Eumeta japonica]